MGEQTKTLETIVGSIPVYGTVIKTAIEIWEFAHNFGRDTPLELAISQLQRQIDALLADLEEVKRRVDALALRIANGENHDHVNKLSELCREAKRVAFRISQNPFDANERALLAFDAVALANRFLEERDIWEWTDVAFTRDFDYDGNLLAEHVELLPSDFKAHLALPTYAQAIMLMLAAIDLDTKGEPVAVRQKYGRDLERHGAAVVSRPDWNEFEKPPQTLAEEIRVRITCRPLPLNKYAADGECVFAIVCENVMERRSTVIRDVNVTLADRGPSVFCTVNPDICRFDEEAIEGEKGVLLLSELGLMMQRVLQNGSLREPNIGRFLMSPTLPLAVLYGVRHDGSVDWHRQVSGDAPGAPASWQGPVRTTAGFEIYTKVFPAGGNDLYGLRNDGVVQWLSHNDFNDGGPGWTGPRDITFGWNDPSIISITPGGDRVIYVLNASGELWWYKHDGSSSGFSAAAWSGPLLVGAGFHQYRRLFSVNEGVIYAVANDGRLLWHRHRGFKDGSNVWDSPRQVGTGWQNFRDIFGADGGVIYAQEADGTLLRYVHLGWDTGDFRWIDPVPVAVGVGGYKQVVTLMSRAPAPIK